MNSLESIVHLVLLFFKVRLSKIDCCSQQYSQTYAWSTMEMQCKCYLCKFDLLNLDAVMRGSLYRFIQRLSVS